MVHTLFLLTKLKICAKMYKFRRKGAKFHFIQLSDHYRVYFLITCLKIGFIPRKIVFFVRYLIQEIRGVEIIKRYSKWIRCTRAVDMIQNTCEFWLHASGIRCVTFRLFGKRKSSASKIILLHLNDKVPCTTAPKQIDHLQVLSTGVRSGEYWNLQN